MKSVNCHMIGVITKKTIDADYWENYPAKTVTQVFKTEATKSAVMNTLLYHPSDDQIQIYADSIVEDGKEPSQVGDLQADHGSQATAQLDMLFLHQQCKSSKIHVMWFTTTVASHQHCMSFITDKYLFYSAIIGRTMYYTDSSLS